MKVVARIFAAAIFGPLACARELGVTSNKGEDSGASILAPTTKKHRQGIRKLFTITNHRAITQTLKGLEVDGLSFSQRALDQVKLANALVDTRFLAATPHCDNEELAACSQKILDDLTRAENCLLEEPPKGFCARNAFGEALHTLQDFYSHSNWADLNTNDGAINTDLGVTTIPKPPRGQQFCENDGGTFLPGVTDLTSGYFTLNCFNNDPDPGKCSHGPAPFCSDRPGINKDKAVDEVSRRAYAQATEATSNLLDNLLSREGIGRDQVAAFFGQRSVAVVVDTTGSMSNDITSVRGAVLSSIVSNPVVAALSPVYISVPFNDPGAGPASVTDDPAAFLSSVNSFGASGGGDCPELSGRGLLLAVRESLPFSIIWLFTDADAKDRSLFPLVRAEARSKNVQVNFGLTGTCSRRRARRGLQTSSVDPLYTELALETGGQVFSGPRDDVGNIMNNIDLQIQEDFVTLGRYRVSLPSSSIPISVDETLTSILFSASTFDGSISSVQITRPDMTLVVDTDPDVNITLLGDNQVVTILGPAVGEWTINVTGSGTATIIVQGNSPINIDYFQFVDTVLGRYEEMLVEVPGGNPIADGELAKALTRVEGPAIDSTFSLVDTAGNLITTVVEEADGGTMIAPDDTLLGIELPDTPFSVVVEGVTAMGNNFQRLAVPVYTPQGIKVSFDQRSLPAFIPPDTQVDIQIDVENFGIEEIVVNVLVVDTLGFVAEFSPTKIVVPAGSVEVITATLITPDDCTKAVTRVAASASVGDLVGNSDILDISVCEPSPPTSSPTTSPTAAPSGMFAKAQKSGKMESSKSSKMGSGKSGKAATKNNGKSNKLGFLLEESGCMSLGQESSFSFDNGNGE